MITVTVRSLTPGGAAERAVSAATIERAVELAGPNAHVVFPTDGDRFFGRGATDAAKHPAAQERAQERAASSGPARRAIPGPPSPRALPRAAASEAVVAP